MIYLFAGDDTEKKLASYEAFLESNSSNVEILKLNRNDFDPNQLISLYSGSGLFSNKYLVIFINFCEYEETRDFILEKLEYMASSQNDFVFIEGKLNKGVLDSFKKTRAELNISELLKVKLEKFDNFLIANAFGVRDKLRVWVCFRQAIDRGVAMEEIVGVLFWKIKDMLIKKNFSKFKEEELKSYAVRLSYLLPEARREGFDAEAVMEKFLLDAF